MVGALLVGLPGERLYLLSAIPFAVGAVVCFLVHGSMRRASRRIRSWRKGSRVIFPRPMAEMRTSRPRASVPLCKLDRDAFRAIDEDQLA